MSTAPTSPAVTAGPRRGWKSLSTWIGAVKSKGRAHDALLAWRMLRHLREGDILIADRSLTSATGKVYLYPGSASGPMTPRPGLRESRPWPRRRWSSATSARDCWSITNSRSRP